MAQQLQASGGIKQAQVALQSREEKRQWGCVGRVVGWGRQESEHK